jgi:hypothetical protein
MSTVGNGTTGASGTGPASGYNLVLSHLFIVFFLFLYRLNANTSNPYAAIILLIFTHSMIYFMIFGIKICRKIPKTLTLTWRGGWIKQFLSMSEVSSLQDRRREDVHHPGPHPQPDGLSISACRLQHNKNIIMPTALLKNSFCYRLVSGY